MVYLIWVILGGLALFFKNNKYVTALVFSYIAILFCFNTANADLNNYMLQYRGLRLYATEPLFALVSNSFLNEGASFELFRAFVAIASLSLITWTFYKLTPYPTLALFMYSIYPLTLDVTQLRFTIAYAIAFCGTYFLIKHQTSHKKKDVVLFFAMIILSAGFHYVTALYAILGLIVFDIRRHRMLYLVLIPLAVVAGVSMIDKFAPIVASVIGLHKTDLWIYTERDSSILRIGRILIGRGLPMMFSVLTAFIAKNQMYKKIYGGGYSERWAD